MAFPPHIQTALKIFPHLVEAAKRGERTTCEQLGMAADVNTRLLSKPLAFIRDRICVSHNLPPLTVIVENKGKDRLVNTFSPEDFVRLSPAEYEALKAEMIAKVYAYPKWDQVLDGVARLYCLV